MREGSTRYVFATHFKFFCIVLERWLLQVCIKRETDWSITLISVNINEYPSINIRLFYKIHRRPGCGDEPARPLAVVDCVYFFRAAACLPTVPACQPAGFSAVQVVAMATSAHAPRAVVDAR